MTKLCTKCSTNKEEHEFSPGRNTCNICRLTQKKLYRDTHKDKIKNHWKTYYAEHKQILSCKHKQRKQLQPIEIRRQQFKEYVKNNLERMRAHYRKSDKKKKECPLKALKMKIRKLLQGSLSKHGFIKNSKTHILLGCSFEEFLIKVGKRPEGDYHLDHICPCAQAQNEEELIKLQHWSNLQWVPASVNLSKRHSKTKQGVRLCRNLLGREWIE